MLLPDEVDFLKLNSFELYDKPIHLGGALLDHVNVGKVLEQFTVICYLLYIYFPDHDTIQLEISE